MDASITQLLGPEMILVATACVSLLLGLGRRGAAVVATGVPAIGAVAVALVLSFPRESSNELLVGYHLRIDGLVHTTRVVVYFVGLLILLVNVHLPSRSECGEFHAMILLSLAGVPLVAAANDLVLFFFAFELVSVPTYVLVGASSSDARAQEAGVKYFFLGALSAALMVYGLSFLYGATGSTALVEFSSDGSLAPLAVMGLVLALAGVAFKMAAVPFHFYAADVYQGAASPVTGLLGFVPKIAGVVALARLLWLVGWPLAASPTLFWTIWILAAATMIVGNVLALLQSNVKRILAYSSVGHSGYLLVALLVGVSSEGAGAMHNGVAAAIFYIGVYGVMNLGAFAVLAYLANRGKPIETLDELAGLSRSYPLAALAMAVCLFSLMGMPPTAGFLGKVFIFSSALTAGDSALVALAIIGLLTSAVGAAYYLRVIAACYLRTPTVPLKSRPSATLETAIAVCATLMLLLGVLPDGLVKLSQFATGGMQRNVVVMEPVADAPMPTLETAETVREADVVAQAEALH